MLDSDLSGLYGVEIRALNQAVTRNKERFPKSFMFELSLSEQRNLKSQIVTSSLGTDSTSENWGGRRKLVKVFTEHGILMLANVLRSKLAVKVSIQIIEAFIKLRKQLVEMNEKSLRLDAIGRRLTEHDEAFTLFNDIILPLLEASERPKRKIGFKLDKKKGKVTKK